MGYPYHELITPAILLDNPGLTREEFTSHFQNIPQCDGILEYKNTDPWDIVSPENFFRSDELARRLYLEYSQTYIDFQTKKRDASGCWIYPPELKKTESGYEVIKHIDNELGSFESIEIEWEWNIEEGKSINVEDDNDYLVDKVLKNNENQYTLEVQPIKLISEVEVFSSEEELFEKWPQFKPENMYDWSQTKGEFKVLMGEKSFLWKNINGRFFLDKKTFDHIPYSFRSGNYGYTDMILTKEAIRHQAWKLLSRRGLVHLHDFLEDFPDSKAEYEKAIWDSHTSLWAKSKEMNHFELIRMRVTPHGVD